MKIGEYLDFSIGFNGTPLELNPHTVSFYLKESIHDFFCSAKITITDSSGLLSNNLVFVDGAPFTLSLQDSQSKLPQPMTKYIVDFADLPNTMIPGIFGGEWVLSLKHDFFGKQTYKASVKKTTISSAVSEAMSDIPLQKIEPTTALFQVIRFDEREEPFVRRLSRLAVTSTLAKTPFFPFISLDGTFNFISYEKMLATDSGITLRYIKPTTNAFLKTDILELRALTNGYDPLLKSKKLKMVSRSKDGTFKTEIDDLSSKHLGTLTKTPAVYTSTNEGEIIYGSYSDAIDVTLQPSQDLKTLALVNEMRRGTLFDFKLYAKTLLNTDLRAGTTITTEIYIEDNGIKLSEFLSGKYVIETVAHFEDKAVKIPYTEMIISRRDTTIPSTYNLLGQTI